jgi:hypothetical protein
MQNKYFIQTYFCYVTCGDVCSFLQSPDGDIIDCILIHEQPAFDHPLLKGQRPLVYIFCFGKFNYETLINNFFMLSKILYFNFITGNFHAYCNTGSSRNAYRS